jgi:hypothetical protein
MKLGGAIDFVAIGKKGDSEWVLLRPRAGAPPLGRRGARAKIHDIV